MASIYLVNDTKYFSMRRKFSRWKLVCKFIIKVAMLSAVSFPELSLLELLLLHILSLNSEPALFLVNNWLTHSGRKFPYTSKLKKRKDISTVINPLKKRLGWSFEMLSKGKFTRGIGNTQRSWSLVFLWLALLAMSNALDKNKAAKPRIYPA